MHTCRPKPRLGTCTSFLALFIDELLVDTNRKQDVIAIGYADDIDLLTRSWFRLQVVFNIIERKLIALNLFLNVKKCVCLRIGPRFKKPCTPLVSVLGTSVDLVCEMRYLGVYLVAGRSFRVSISKAHSKFSKAVNGIFSKLLGHVDENVIVYLIKMQCLPILLYGTEVVGLTASFL